MEEAEEGVVDELVVCGYWAGTWLLVEDEDEPFVAAFCGMLTVVSAYYPDKPSAPRTFPGGLEAELGGPRAVIARKTEDE